MSKATQAQIKVAAMLLDRDEGGTSSLDWAMNFIKTGIDAVHDGDCTNQCHSCHRCLTDRAIADAIAIEAALTAAETGEQTASSIRAENERIARMKATTIERCAQIARDTLLLLDYPIPVERVVAAIRALKEQS